MPPSQPADIESWIRNNGARLQSPFEQLFARNVLAQVPDIDLDSVDAQYPFTDSDGGRRFCDFVIREGQTLRIAIEIDGYDKTGRGAGMSHREFVDWQRRHASLVAQGWDVIRFANYDVKHCAARCIDHVSLLLRRERSKVAATVNSGLSETEQERLQQFEQAQQEIEHLKGETNLMKTTIWAFVVVVVAMMYFVFHRVNEPVPSAPLTHASASAAVAASQVAQRQAGLSCSDPLDWAVAAQYNGQVRAFSGPVAGVISRPNVNAKPTFINVGEAFPSKRRLTAIIWAENAERFRDVLQGGISGRTICVVGAVDQKDGVAQIILKDRSQLSYR